MPIPRIGISLFARYSSAYRRPTQLLPLDPRLDYLVTKELWMNLKHNLFAATAAVLLATGAANAQLVVRIGPPPPRPVEVIPAPPRAHRDWVWVGGYHRWDGRRYA